MTGRVQLQTGDQAPAFTLAGVGGGRYDLVSMLAEGPVLLYFMRGTWCTACRSKLRELSLDYAARLTSGVQVVAIAHQRADIVASYFRLEPTPIPYLLDPTLTVIRAYGVQRSIPASEWQPIVEAGVVDKLGLDARLGQLNGPVVAYPAIFLVDQQRTIRWLHIGNDVYDWPAEVLVAEQLAAL